MTMQTPVEEDPQAEKAKARVGEVLQGKWRLDALVGVGGMAAVYAATHRNGKRVAVKMLHPEYSRDDDVRSRFLREGYAANAIGHDGAVSVLDDDVAADGSAFLVMELLEGETLEARFHRAPHNRLPPREVLWAADRLLDVLASAHAKSVVHRDIKPENLFLTRTGVLKVLDFGIAKVFERKHQGPKATVVGQIMGTPAYMAPEQARARWEEVDGRTDLWAVGATMFTLLSGRFVHQAETGQEQLIEHATARAPALASVAPDVPPPVAHIVDRALAYERDKRWPDAATMQRAVRAALRALGSPEPARSASGPRASPGATAAAAQAPGAEEIAKRRTAIAQMQQTFADSRRRTAQAQADLDAGRKERAQLAQWFERQVGTRAAAVEEARKAVRRQAVQIAQRAAEDSATFGKEIEPAREQIAELLRAAESAKRDVDVHAAALEAYDARSLRAGVVLLGFAAALALALVVVPIVWRATRVVEAPPPEPAPDSTTLSPPAR